MSRDRDYTEMSSSLPREQAQIVQMVHDRVADAIRPLEQNVDGAHILHGLALVLGSLIASLPDRHKREIALDAAGGIAAKVIHTMEEAGTAGQGEFIGDDTKH